MGSPRLTQGSFGQARPGLRLFVLQTLKGQSSVRCLKFACKLPHLIPYQTLGTSERGGGAPGSGARITTTKPQSAPSLKPLKGAFCSYGNTGLRTIIIPAARSQRAVPTDGQTDRRGGDRHPDALCIHSAPCSTLQLVSNCRVPSRNERAVPMPVAGSLSATVTRRCSPDITAEAAAPKAAAVAAAAAHFPPRWEHKVRSWGPHEPTLQVARGAGPASRLACSSHCGRLGAGSPSPR